MPIAKGRPFSAQDVMDGINLYGGQLHGEGFLNWYFGPRIPFNTPQSGGPLALRPPVINLANWNLFDHFDSVGMAIAMMGTPDLPDILFDLPPPGPDPSDPLNVFQGGDGGFTGFGFFAGGYPLNAGFPFAGFPANSVAPFMRKGEPLLAPDTFTFLETQVSTITVNVNVPPPPEGYNFPMFQADYLASLAALNAYASSEPNLKILGVHRASYFTDSGADPFGNDTAWTFSQLRICGRMMPAPQPWTPITGPTWPWPYSP